MASLSQHQELVFPIYQMICMVPRLIVNFGIVLESKGCVFFGVYSQPLTT